jgi:hypothetical protein
MTVEEIAGKVKRCLPFLKPNKGGVTISGGEPLWQAPFVLEVFKLAKGMGLTTCLDTSGYGGAAKNEDMYRSVLEQTDRVCACLCMHVCIYVYVYICTYACMYVCTYVCMHVCVYVCMYARMYACMYVYMYVCMYVCISVLYQTDMVRVSPQCTCVCMCICIVSERLSIPKSVKKLSQLGP